MYTFFLDLVCITYYYKNMARIRLFRKGKKLSLACGTIPGVWTVLRDGEPLAEIKRSAKWLLLEGNVCMVFNSLTELFQYVESKFAEEGYIRSAV